MEEFPTSEKFWSKAGRIARFAGRELLSKAFQLYYAFPSAPAPAKAVIAGALGYLVLPADAIPDALPGIGLTDDLGVLASALLAVSVHIDEDVVRKAETALEKLGVS